MSQKAYPRTSRETVEKLLEDTLNDTGKFQRPEKPKKKPLQKVLSIISIVLMLALLSTLGYLIYYRVQGQNPSLFGYRIYVIETGSMIPTLPVGSFVVVDEIDKSAALSVGDIVTYSYQDMTITHRIVEVNSDNGVYTYHTKGDNPINSVDPWTITNDNIIGKLKWHIQFHS